MDRKAKNRSERKTRIKIPIDIAAEARITSTGSTSHGFPLLLCLACSTFFLHGKKNIEFVDFTLPNFCPNCGRQRADLNQEDSHDG